MSDGRRLERPHAAEWARALREAGKRLVFTNGCFDILHAGHVRLLAAARSEGDLLLVGVNDDESVRALKGPDRPLNALPDRLEVLAALRSVDAVVPFHEETPLALIGEVIPDVLVKGADYEKSAIVGAEVVEAAGGRVVRVPLVAGRSTTGLLKRVSRSRKGPS